MQKCWAGLEEDCELTEEVLLDDTMKSQLIGREADLKQKKLIKEKKILVNVKSPEVRE